MNFTPLKDFFSEELRSSYAVGLSYTARPEDKELLQLLPKWIKEGKVRQGFPDAAPGEAKVGGSGTVT